MFDKNHIERVLRINGIAPTAPDEEIRAVLLNAHYRDEEIDIALSVLRENVVTKETHVDGLLKLLRTDKNLTAKEVSSLLGVEIKIPQFVEREKTARSQKITGRHWLVIWLLAFFVSGLGISLAMYVLEFGIFHPATSILFYENW